MTMTTMNGQRRDEDAMNKFWPVILTAETRIIRGVNFAIKKIMKIINEVERESGQPFEGHEKASRRKANKANKIKGLEYFTAVSGLGPGFR